MPQHLASGQPRCVFGWRWVEVAGGDRLTLTSPNYPAAYDYYSHCGWNIWVSWDLREGKWREWEIGDMGKWRHGEPLGMGKCKDGRWGENRIEGWRDLERWNLRDDIENDYYFCSFRLSSWISFSPRALWLTVREVLLQRFTITTWDKNCL